MVKGYCMKCKEKVEITNPKTSLMKNGKTMTKGTCSKDKATTVCSIGANTSGGKRRSSGRRRSAGRK